MANATKARVGAVTALGALWRAWGPWAVVAAMVLVILLIAAVMRGSAMMHARPAWWKPVSSQEPEVVGSALEFENNMISALYMRRAVGDSVWDLGVRPETANAWLSERLPKWVAMQVRDELGEDLVTDLDPVEARGVAPGQDPGEGVWPREITEVQVSFQREAIHIGARLERDGRERYVSASLRPEVREDGSLWMVAQRVYMGRLGLPASWVLSEAERRAEDLLPEVLRALPEAETYFEIFQGERPLRVDPEIKLGDGRKVRLLTLQAMSDGRLYMQFRTLAPAAGPAAGPEAQAGGG